MVCSAICLAKVRERVRLQPKTVFLCTKKYLSIRERLKDKSLRLMNISQRRMSIHQN